MFCFFTQCRKIANELLQEYTIAMNERVKSFGLLQRGYLPSSLVSPSDLQSILNKLVTQLSSKHTFLRLYHDNIDAYYGNKDVNKIMSITYKYQFC